jgi:hypothetical protein
MRRRLFVISALHPGFLFEDKRGAIFNRRVAINVRTRGKLPSFSCIQQLTV